MDVGDPSDWSGGVNRRIVRSFVWGPALEISQYNILCIYNYVQLDMYG